MLLRAQRVEVNQQDDGERVVLRVQREDQLRQLQSGARTSASRQKLRVFKENDEERAVLLSSVVQPADPARRAEHGMESALERVQRVLDQFRCHRVVL